MGDIKILADKVWKEGRVPPNERVRQFTDLLDSGTQPSDADLTAIAALSGTGIAARTAADTWALRTITGTSARITLTNGDGVSGNPTVDIADTYVGQTSITTLGTIATGVWNGTDIAVADGGTGASTAAGAATNLGLGTGDSPQFTAVNVGHATDTTLSRAAAGTIAVENSPVYQQNNILGTVSQSVGTPTGAIIENGSNTNGKYVKFADGTMICTKLFTGQGPVDNAVGNVFASAAFTWTFPVEFSAIPQVASYATGASYLWVSGGSNVSTTTIPQLIIMRPASSASTSLVVHATAIGRWF